jgi:hypothetical protein
MENEGRGVLFYALRPVASGTTFVLVTLAAPLHNKPAW